MGAKSKTKKPVSEKLLNAVVVMTMMASVVLAVWQIPTAAASSLEEIKVSREISAPVDQVWSIVSDIDNETKYWSTFKNIKNINKVGNTTEREVTLVAGPQGETKTHQFITVNPEQFVVELNITEGPVTGTRVLTLSPSAEDNTKTKIDAVWKVDLSGIPIFGRGFAKDGITGTTEDALGKIAQGVE
ncbi:MAG: SRPBCC family protein [Thermoproteota archaeon]|nr:SRPBCC family protein [Thermoproteota archaeon]